MIQAIDHLVITVADLEATLGFYERVLGLEREIRPGRPAALLFGDQKINVHQADHTFEPKARRPTEGAADFCLVADRPLAEIRAHLERQGVAIELGPVGRNGARSEMTSLYFRDPDGNLIEIAEYPSDA
ncbi:virulence protein [Aureimonas endophytica]|uniref:Virulence protein n=1 Tax=Aureimonas endophytica TaxID=2027858 RepID=A0A917E1R8_9HYPH|nr:VOC family protein [Aureimonas endophytica]GGD91141.1 virulence protein [Aureimonas endophytica]